MYVINQQNNMAPFNGTSCLLLACLVLLLLANRVSNYLATYTMSGAAEIELS